MASKMPVASPLKGVAPEMSSCSSTPRPHQSTGLPWPFILYTSGAAYAGVPQSVYVDSPLASTLLSPKSAIFT
jgi:hypothetical protein